MSLVDYVKQATEKECQSLSPDADMLPTLLYRDADDKRYVIGLAVDMDEGMGDVPALMTASLVLDEAIEAAYSSFVWSVEQAGDPDGRYQGGPMLSQHPDRVEQAMILHYTPDGMAMYFASVTRSVDAPPVLGEWVADIVAAKVGGRIARSMETGLRMAASMPDEARSVFRMARAAGDSARQGALRGVMRALRDS